MPEDKEIIDVHCHFFTAVYAVMELAAVTWNNLRGNYPHHKAAIAERKRRRKVIPPLEGISELAGWIARLTSTVLSDCEGNYLTTQKKFMKSSLGVGHSLLVVPLMMDIYYVWDNNKDEEIAKGKRRRAKHPVEPFAVPRGQKKDFEEHFETIKMLIEAEIQKLPVTAKRRSLSNQEVENVFEAARKGLLEPPASKRRDDKYAGIEMSPGYKKHMHDLEELSAKYPGKIFPFLAVDPRRIGIMDLIEMKINQGKGVFKGIKIYPSLGYLPTHPNLKPVFAYCVKYGIPVTVHCSQSGMQNYRGENYVVDWTGNNHWEDFQSVDKNKSRYFADPRNWLPVLEEFPKLRLNFAHFGGNDQFDQPTGPGSQVWLESIVEMMQNPKYTIYADISYYAKEEYAGQVLDILKKHEILNSHLMFGTDFIMIMQDKELGGLERYFSNFAGLNNNLLRENARTFLGL